MKYRLELLINGVPTLHQIEGEDTCEDLNHIKDVRRRIWLENWTQPIRVVEIGDKILEGYWQIEGSADELDMIACKEHNLELYVGYGKCSKCGWSEVHAMYGQYKHKELNNE